MRFLRPIKIRFIVLAPPFLSVAYSQFGMSRILPSLQPSFETTAESVPRWVIVISQLIFVFNAIAYTVSMVESFGNWLFFLLVFALLVATLAAYVGLAQCTRWGFGLAGALLAYVAYDGIHSLLLIIGTFHLSDQLSSWAIFFDGTSYFLLSIGLFYLFGFVLVPVFCLGTFPRFLWIALFPRGK
jgi:hypothetical protein